MSREVSILRSKPGASQLWTSSVQNQDVTTEEKEELALTGVRWGVTRAGVHIALEEKVCLKLRY